MLCVSLASSPLPTRHSVLTALLAPIPLNQEVLVVKHVLVVVLLLPATPSLVEAACWVNTRMAVDKLCAMTALLVNTATRVKPVLRVFALLVKQAIMQPPLAAHSVYHVTVANTAKPMRWSAALVLPVSLSPCLSSMLSALALLAMLAHTLPL